MCHKKYVSIVLFLMLVAYIGGCTPSESVETSVPEGWETNGTYWWRTGFDTTDVFRNLDTFADMGVGNVGITFVANAQASNRSGSPQDIFERRVQRSLIRLYRNQPMLVDSLFERYVRPSLAGKGDPDKMDALVDQYQRKSYGVIRNHFQEPQTALILGKDVEVPYPDSLVLVEHGPAGRPLGGFHLGVGVRKARPESGWQLYLLLIQPASQQVQPAP
jgi:hypothetical protein